MTKHPEGPKHVPRVHVKTQLFLFDIEDSPFESKLSCIYRAGLQEQRQRLAREDAFKLKLGIDVASMGCIGMYVCEKILEMIWDEHTFCDRSPFSSVDWEVVQGAWVAGEMMGKSVLFSQYERKERLKLQ